MILFGRTGRASLQGPWLVSAGHDLAGGAADADDVGGRGEVDRGAAGGVADGHACKGVDGHGGAGEAVDADVGAGDGEGGVMIRSYGGHVDGGLELFPAVGLLVGVEGGVGHVEGGAVVHGVGEDGAPGRHGVVAGDVAQGVVVGEGGGADGVDGGSEHEVGEGGAAEKGVLAQVLYLGGNGHGGDFRHRGAGALADDAEVGRQSEGRELGAVEGEVGDGVGGGVHLVGGKSAGQGEGVDGLHVLGVEHSVDCGEILALRVHGIGCEGGEACDGVVAVGAEGSGEVERREAGIGETVVAYGLEGGRELDAGQGEGVLECLEADRLDAFGNLDGGQLPAALEELLRNLGDASGYAGFGDGGIGEHCAAEEVHLFGQVHLCEVGAAVECGLSHPADSGGQLDAGQPGAVCERAGAEPVDGGGEGDLGDLSGLHESEVADAVDSPHGVVVGNCGGYDHLAGVGARRPGHVHGLVLAGVDGVVDAVHLESGGAQGCQADKSGK